MKSTILILLVLIGHLAIGQNSTFKGLFKGTIQDTSWRHNENDTICFIQGENIVKTTTSKKGKYNLKVELNATQSFKLLFYSPAFITKVIEFDMSEADIEQINNGLKDGYFKPVQQLNMRMDSIVEDHDLEIVVAKFYWRTKLNSVGLNAPFTEFQRKYLIEYKQENDSILKAKNYNLNSSIFKIGDVYRPKENIRYKLGKSNVDTRSYGHLDSIALFLMDHLNFTIEVGTHTDTRGSKKMPLNLSRARAKNVVDYLISKGVLPSQLTYNGYEDKEPIIEKSAIKRMKSKQDQEEAHYTNRRTEFKITSLSRPF